MPNKWGTIAHFKTLIRLLIIIEQRCCHRKANMVSIVFITGVLNKLNVTKDSYVMINSQRVSTTVAVLGQTKEQVFCLS